MVELGHDTLTPQLQDILGKAKDVQEKLDAQKAIIAAELAKGKAADKAVITAAQAQLATLREPAQKVIDSASGLFTKRRKADAGQQDLFAQIDDAINDDANLDFLEQIDKVNQQVMDASIKNEGVKDETSATRVADRLQKESETRDLSDAEQLALYAFRELERVKAEMAAMAAGRTTGTEPAPTATEPAGGDKPEPTEPDTESDEEEGEGRIREQLKRFDKWVKSKLSAPSAWLLERRIRGHVGAPLEKHLDTDLAEISGMLEQSQAPKDKEEAKYRRKTLIPFLGVIQKLGVLDFELTEAAQKIVDGRQDDINELVVEYNKEDEEDGRKYKLDSLKTWVRRNKHKILALEEVVKNNPADGGSDLPDNDPEGTPVLTEAIQNGIAGTNPEDDGQSTGDVGLGQANPAPETVVGRTEPPKEDNVEKQNKNKLKAVYEQVIKSIDGALTDDDKIDLVPAVPAASRWQAIDRIMNITSSIAEGKTQQAFDEKSENNVNAIKALVLAARVKSYYGEMRNPRKTQEQLNQFVNEVVQKLAV